MPDRSVIAKIGNPERRAASDNAVSSTVPGCV